MDANRHRAAYVQLSESNEQALLNDIEARTKNINAKSKELKTEAQSQVIMLENLERNMETTEEELRRQTKNIRSAKEMNENICWMYVVILCEALLLCFLVWIGLVG